MKRTHLHLLLPLLAAPLAACSDGGIPPEVLEQRREAARGACIGRQLLGRAEQNLNTLAPLGTAGVAVYARVYHEHAQLRASALAQADSAANYSPEPGDSARHAEAAARFAVRAPEAGSVEANAAAQYNREFAQMYADADHPCNWDFPDELRLDSLEREG